MPHFTLVVDPRSGPVINAGVAVSDQRAKALKKAGRSPPAIRPIKALIDTGASATCIDPSVMSALGLNPTGTAKIFTPSSGHTAVEHDQYDVGILIQARSSQVPLHIGTVGVISAQLKFQGIDALIGRDILSQCILQYNGSVGQFSLAF